MNLGCVIKFWQLINLVVRKCERIGFGVCCIGIGLGLVWIVADFTMF